MADKWKDIVDKLYCVLELDRKAVGMKLLKNEKEFEEADARVLPEPINYCQMVASATRGNRLKASNKDIMCRSAPRVLGIESAEKFNDHGEHWGRLGLYDSYELAAKVREELVYSTEEQYGVLVAPIEQFEDFPDVILIAANPYNCMRIVQGYAYHYGMPKSFNLIGNQAICLECSGRPYLLKDMNISLLCIGTRHRAGWRDDEMAAGIPAEQFANVVDGLFQTVNIMENDHNKKIIDQKLKEHGIPLEIRYHYNYYMDC